MSCMQYVIFYGKKLPARVKICLITNLPVGTLRHQTSAVSCIFCCVMHSLRMHKLMLGSMQVCIVAWLHLWSQIRVASFASLKPNISNLVLFESVLLKIVRLAFLVHFWLFFAFFGFNFLFGSFSNQNFKFLHISLKNVFGIFLVLLEFRWY